VPLYSQRAQGSLTPGLVGSVRAGRTGAVAWLSIGSVRVSLHPAARAGQVHAGLVVGLPG
jgi:hypothetical protein